MPDHYWSFISLFNNMGKNKKDGKVIDKLYDYAFKANQKLLDLFKETSNPEAVTVLLDKADFVPTAYELGHMVETQGAAKGELVKGNVSESPLVEGLTLKNLKLDVFGPNEDKAYALDPFLMKNIRRGNTLLEFADKRSYIGRKGLPKFFDMSVEFIDPVTRRDMQQLSVEKRMQKNYQLAGPLKALL